MANLTQAEQQARDYLGNLAVAARRGEILAGGPNSPYRLGRIDRRTRDWQPHGYSGNSAIYEDDDLITRRTRDSVRNVGQAKRLRDACTNLIVGDEMRTFADPFDLTDDFESLQGEKLKRPLRQALESDKIYQEWFYEKSRFSADGRMSGPEMQRMAVGECITVGSSIIVESFRTGPDGVSEPCYQIIEREQLDIAKDRPGDAAFGPIVNGIEYRRDGQPIRYHILDAHPDDNFTGGRINTSTPIPASRVIHLFLGSRPTDTIGATWFDSVAQNQLDRDKFLGAEIQTAAKGALLLLVAKMKHMRAGQTMGLYDDQPDSDSFGNTEMKLGSSPFAARIGAEDDLKLLESNRPNATAESFIGLLDRDTASSLGLSWYSLAGDYRATSFSSAHCAALAEDASFRPLQWWFASHFALPLRQRFTSLALMTGRHRLVSAGNYLASPKRYLRFDAIGAGREYMDPEAQVSAVGAKIRMGLSSLKIECARRGLHWVEVLLQRSIETTVASMLGVQLDFSKGNGGQPGEGDKSESKPKKKEANAHAA
jgi:lambda family phage portal protein